MTPEEITEIMEASTGKLTDWQCRCLVHYMMGYLRYAKDIETARTVFFTQIKHATAEKAVPVI